MQSYAEVFDTICRVCSQVNCREMVPLLEENGTTLTCYGQAMTTFADVQISNQDLLPNKMCKSCLGLLRSAIKFKKMSENNHQNMTTLISSISWRKSYDYVKESIVDYCIYTENFPKGIDIENICRDFGNNDDVENQNDLDDYPDIDDDETHHSDWNDEVLDQIETLFNGDHNDAINEAMEKQLVGKRKKRQRSKQNVKTEWECEFCQKKYNVKTSYLFHRRRHFGLKFICEHCGKGFVLNAELRMHQVTVHGIGAYLPCPHCDFKASRSFQLKEHIRLHTGERPFTCDKCGLTFRRKAIYNKHLVYHTEKVHQCSQCPRRFYVEADLKAHCNNVHERRYVYSCRLCPVTYAKATGLRRHLLDVHGIPRESQGRVLRVALNPSTKVS